MKSEELVLRRKNIENAIEGITYIGSLIDIKKIGSVYSAMCVWHNEKTPSLRIYPKGYKNSDGKVQDTTSFYCFGCGAHGHDVVAFEQLYYDLETVEEACASLENKFGLRFDEDNRMASLRIALKEIQSKNTETISLTEINFICSIMCRNYLRWIQAYYPLHFDCEFDYIQNIYRKLDHQLLERNALQAKELIDITKRTLYTRKQKFASKNA